MKYLSFTVPCYNSQAYMRKCIESLLVGGDDVEIIVVNDGSQDGTLSVAREYEAAHPEIVRVLDKENGGHGSGVNAGLSLAEGLYFKVVDSDDWADAEALRALLETVRRHAVEGISPDAYIVNYVYEHAADNTAHVSDFRKNFPKGEIVGWNRVKPFHGAKLLLMHALVYKTDVLRKSGLVLPEHTFYVDDIYSYSPLPYVETLCYLDLDFYRYFIGRADQSVNLSNMVKRYGQMVRVMLEMTDRWSYAEIKSQTANLRKYLFHALADYMLTAQLFLCAEDTAERRASYRAMWKHIREKDAKLYRKLRYRTSVLAATVLPWKLRAFVIMKVYRYLCRKVKLG